MRKPRPPNTVRQPRVLPSARLGFRPEKLSTSFGGQIWSMLFTNPRSTRITTTAPPAINRPVLIAFWSTWLGILVGPHSGRVVAEKDGAGHDERPAIFDRDYDDERTHLEGLGIVADC